MEQQNMLELEIIHSLLANLERMSEDQLATAHLLIVSYMQFEFSKKAKYLNRAFGDYMTKTERFLKDSLQRVKPAKTPFDGELANYALFKLLSLHGDMYDDPETAYRSYLGLVKKISDNYQTLLENKNFREYFNDIEFEEGCLISLKALMLDKKIIEMMMDDIKEKAQELNNPELLFHCEESWKKTRPLLNDLDYKVGILFHCICLELCHEALIPKGYAKYQKNVVKMVSAYSTNANQIQKQFTFKNTTQAFLKLKEKMLEFISEEPIEEEPFLQFKEVFSLSTDICLRNIVKINPDEAASILECVSVDGDDLSTSEQVQQYWESFYHQAEEEYRKLLGEEEDEEESESDDEDEEAEYGQYSDELEDTKDEDTLSSPEKNPENEEADKKASIEESLKKERENLKQLDFVHDTFLHAVACRIMEIQVLPEDYYSNYKSAVETLLETYNGTSSSDKETARKKADTSFESVQRKMLEKVCSFKPSEISQEETNLIFKCIFTTAPLTSALQEIPQIDQESIKETLSSYKNSKNPGSYFMEVCNAYAFKYIGYIMKNREYTLD